MIITLDFETYYGPDYTLSKMRTTDYIEDARFHVHGVGIKVGTQPTYWVSDREDIAAHLRTLPWDRAHLLCHNAPFDASILAVHYGIIPKFYLDTMAMGRALHGAYCGASLDGLCQYLGLGRKIAGELIKTYGRASLEPAELAALGGYCIQDVDLTYALFNVLRAAFPTQELVVVDTMVRMATQPRLRLQAPLLIGALEAERARKEGAVAAAGVPLTTLRSPAKFGAFLTSLGVTPPTKVSPTTGEETLATAKDDDAFTALTEHADPRVRAAVEGRLACSSSLMETRLEALARTAARGPLPVHLTYWGAATGRASGANRDNLQNLPRGSALREAIIAADGEMLVVSDLAAIEARGLAWFAGDTELLDIFRAGGDPYCAMAAGVYNRPITKADKAERFVGKVLVLALGYGMSAWRLDATLRQGALGPSVVFGQHDADAMGVNVRAFAAQWAALPPDKRADIRARCPGTMSLAAWVTHMAVCTHLVGLYRQQRRAVTALWRAADACLPYLYQGTVTAIGAPGIQISDRAVCLPDGMRIHYPDMRPADEGNGWSYAQHNRTGTLRVNIYGAKLVENIVQGLAAAILRWQTVECRKAGLRPLLQVHDELVFSVPEAEAKAARARVERIMSTAPPWAVGFPVAAEASVGFDYKTAKK